jgi:TetR/AcrR family transcriptional regulator, cholesterol catabolism regulator
MQDFSSFKRDFRPELGATWQQIYDRHRETIRIKKLSVALPNLEKIVSTTLAISNRSSFHSMSLRDLSREADVSMGALYSYIGSKEQLSAMIVGHVLFLVDTVLTPPADRAAGERLRWLLRTHIYLSEVMQPWFFFAYMEAKSFDRRVRRMAINSELRTERLVAECLADGRAAGTSPPDGPTVAASLVKPLLQDWYLKRWKYRRRGIDPDSYADQVIRFVEAASSPAPVPCRAGEPAAASGARAREAPLPTGTPT